jgi:hypothetical protein
MWEIRKLLRRPQTLSLVILMAAFPVQVAFSLAFGGVSFLAFWTIKSLVTSRSILLVTDVNKCHELLSSTNLKKRAALNQRLVIAFGIENGFTTTSEEVHHRFRKEIKISLERNNNDSTRKDLIELISISVQAFLRKCTDANQEIPLVNVVRIAIFRTVLAIFFPDVPQISDEDVIFITSKMNSLWWDSKSPWKIFLARYFTRHSSIIQDREHLHQKLKEIFPSLPDPGPIKPNKNPLNILLPAFIGVFRVVLRCILEVRFRSTPQNRFEYANLFQQFVQNPNKRWYEEEKGTSVQQIIAETLRLYPPTRRIYTQRGNRVIAVDIEQLHRTGKVWGKKPLEWDPKRWKRVGLDVGSTVEYIPFGGKVERPAEISRCPSRVRGGPKLIAIIVGVLFGVLGEDWKLMENGEGKDEGLGEGPLEGGKDAYEALMLCRYLEENAESVKSN